MDRRDRDPAIGKGLEAKGPQKRSGRWVPAVESGTNADCSQPLVGRPGHSSVGTADQGGLGQPRRSLSPKGRPGHPSVDTADQGDLGHPRADLVTLWWVRPIKATSVTQGSTWSPFGGYGRSRRPRSPKGRPGHPSADPDPQDQASLTTQHSESRRKASTE